MRKTVHKLFWIWDYDKEEQWLNEMAAKGLSLVAVGICSYMFEETTANQYRIRLQLLDKSVNALESENYIRFVEETGAEYLGNVKNRWVYFRKEKETDGFELNTDKAMLFKQLTSLFRLSCVLLAVVLWAAWVNLNIYFTSAGMLANLLVGIANAAVSVLLLYGIRKLATLRKRILKEQQLFE